MTTGINAFDRQNINTRERPVSSDINSLQSRLEQTIKAFARAGLIGHNSGSGVAGASGFNPQSGFYGDGFFPAAVGSSRDVTLTPGLGMILGGTPASNFGSISGVDDLDPFFPVYAPAPITVTIPAEPSGGQERFDIIEVKQDRRVENPTSRDVLNTVTGVFEATSVQKTFAYVLDQTRYGTVTSPGNSSTGVSLKVGAAATAGTATVPATSPGYTRIAVIKSVGGTALILQDAIRDDRKLLFPDGHGHFGCKVTQVDGPPDVLTVLANPLAPAGVRFAARATSATTPGSNVRILVFGGAGVRIIPQVHLTMDVTVNMFASGNYMLAKLSPVQQGIVDTAEAALIGAQVPAMADTLEGQPYAFFDIARTLIAGTDLSARHYYISGTIGQL